MHHQECLDVLGDAARMAMVKWHSMQYHTTVRNKYYASQLLNIMKISVTKFFCFTVLEVCFFLNLQASSLGLSNAMAKGTSVGTDWETMLSCTLSIVVTGWNL